MLKIIGISPHPPLIIPEVGSRGDRERVVSTVGGLQRLARQVLDKKPERLVVITPHGLILREGLAVLTGDRLGGDFSRFGAPQVKVNLSIDQTLLSLLEEETAGESVRPVRLEIEEYFSDQGRALDHGAAVPLYYLQKAGLSVPGLHLSIGLFSYKDLYRFGKSLRRAIERRGLPAAVIACADLSHRLTRDAPGGYSPRGAEFDRLLVRLLKEKRVEELLALDPDLVEQAGECGLRPIIISLGMLDGQEFNTEIISYEGPFGVGYLVAALSPNLGHEEQPDFTTPVGLARKALNYYLLHGRHIKMPRKLPPLLAQKAGAFVTIKKGRELRGCIGTIEPVRSNLAEEISSNAVGAGLRDPRFNPIILEDLKELSFSVDVLTPLEKVNNIRELDPKRYGVLVRSGAHQGVLLPDLEGIDTVEKQVTIARRKAGIAPGEPVTLYRFEVKRYT